MKPSYIAIKSSILTLTMMISAHAQPDTVVLNSTEFRFPETHPGRVFTVQKIVVNGQQPLKKGLETGNPATLSPLAEPASAAANKPARDVMGRLLKTGEYAKRMAKIQKAHQLPVVGRTQQETRAPQLPVSHFQKDEGARFGLNSSSPLIRTSQDLARMEKLEREAVRRKYGSLGKSFSEKVSALRENDSLEIIIELEAEHPGFLNGMKATREERKRNALAWAGSKLLLEPSEFLRGQGLKSSLPENAAQGRMVVAKASKNQILALKAARGVVSVEQAHKPVLNAVPGTAPRSLYDLLTSAYNPSSSMVEYGGLSVATMESGLSTGYAGRLPYYLVPSFYDETVVRAYPEHSEMTYHALAIGTASHAKYHFIGDGLYPINPPYMGYRYGFVDLLSPIVNAEISVLSSSFGALNRIGSSVAGDSVVGFWDEVTKRDSRAVDRMAHIYPYPVTFLTAGNDGYAVTSDSKAYNAMVVGTVQHYDNSSYSVTLKQSFPPTFAIFNRPGSQTKNAQVYGSTRDWELPNLMAPGFTPDPYWGMCIYEIHVDSSGAPSCPSGGSSLSAPIAAAMGAHVMAARSIWDPSRNTEARAILMLTAQNVDSGYWAPGIQDSRDGAGTVSGANAVAFATSASSVGTGSYPVEHGIGSGTFDSTLFQYSVGASYNYRVPSTIPSGKHLRVVVTWNSSPGYNTWENEVSDFALIVQANNGWNVSDAWNGNTEIVDIHNSNLTPGQDYSLEVFPNIYRTASDGPKEVNYTVAWTWVKDHAD